MYNLQEINNFDIFKFLQQHLFFHYCYNITGFITIGNNNIKLSNTIKIEQLEKFINDGFKVSYEFIYSLIINDNKKCIRYLHDYPYDNYLINSAIIFVSGKCIRYLGKKQIIRKIKYDNVLKYEDEGGKIEISNTWLNYARIYSYPKINI